MYRRHSRPLHSLEVVLPVVDHELERVHRDAVVVGLGHAVELFDGLVIGVEAGEPEGWVQSFWGRSHSAG